MKINEKSCKEPDICGDVKNSITPQHTVEMGLQTTFIEIYFYFEEFQNCKIINNNSNGSQSNFKNQSFEISLELELENYLLL